SENYLNRNGENSVLPSKFTMAITCGDVFRHVLDGAAGWGDPLERDPTAALRDVRSVLLSLDTTAAGYGVERATEAWRIDAAASATAERASGGNTLSANAQSKIIGHRPSESRGRSDFPAVASHR